MNFPKSRRSVSPLGRFFSMVLLCAIVTSPGFSNDVPLKPNDGLSLEVFGEESLTRKIRILKSGEAVFPLIGNVHLAGLTLSDATEKIRELYNRDYLVEPKVTLTVDEYAQEFIIVAGAVNRPGAISIPASGKLELSMALATSGGLAPQADPERITVTRASGASATFSETQLRKSGSFTLQPGDTVLVNESPFLGKSIIIQGRVNKPGQIPFPLTGKLDLVTAIAQAGGLHELANHRKVEINRRGTITKLDIKQLSEKGSTRYFLQPDDIITVSERIF